MGNLTIYNSPDECKVIRPDRPVFADTVLYQDENVEVKHCGGKGFGVFALRAFRPGEVVVSIGGQVHENGYGSEYCMQLNDNRLLEPDIPGALANHSCNPNCQLDGGDTRCWLEALVYILPGTEITYEYGWDLEAFPEPKKCLCGAGNCRGYILDEQSAIKYRQSLTRRSKSKGKQGKRRSKKPA